MPAEVKTGGTGDQNNNDQPAQADMLDMPDVGEDFQFSRNRKDDLLQLPLSPHNLLGSFFQVIENGQLKWHGVVVGEPQAKMYLLEFYDWLYDSATDRVVPNEIPVYQRIIPFEEFIGRDGAEWRFYDNYQWMVRDRMRMSIEATRGVT